MDPKKEIKEILEGRGHYGQVKIKQRKISSEITWIGSHGVTNSVGQWICRIKQIIDKGMPPVQGFKWFCHTDLDSSKKQNRMWYFGVQFQDGVGHYHIYVCGGCTDFSGEGGRGYKIADEFLKMILSESDVLTRCADHMISYLVGK